MEEPGKRPDEQDISPIETGEGDPRRNLPGLGRFSSLTPLIFPLVLALIVSWAMVSIMATPKGAYREDITRLETDLVAMRETAQATNSNLQEVNTALTNHVNTLVDKINAFEQPQSQDLSGYAELTDLQPYATREYLTSLLDAKFDEYELALADMEDILDELQLIDEEGEVVTTDEEVRWYSQIYCTNYSEDTIEVALGDVHISPSRIEEADDYSIFIPLLNHYRDSNTTPQPKNDVIISIIFTPKTGSRVAVDEDEIYLDSIYSPFTFWAIDVVERSDGTCRRIRFTSEKIRVPKGTVTDNVFEPGSLDLRLEFTLAYE